MFILFWQLAKLEGSGSYQELMDFYNMRGIYGIHSSPLSFIRVGHYLYSNGSPHEINASGNYWGSKVYDANSARMLGFWLTELHPQFSNPKGYGMSIRCVVR